MNQSLASQGLLKLDLMLRGVRLSGAFEKAYAYKIPRWNLAGVEPAPCDFLLPGGQGVSCCFQKPYVQNSPYQIDLIDERVVLTKKDKLLCEVRWLDALPIAGQEVRPGVCIKDICQVQGRYVSLSLGGHRFLQNSLIQDGSINKKLLLNPDDIVLLLKQVQQFHPFQVISLSAWQTDTPDGGIEQIEPFVREIKKHFTALLFIEVHLPQHKSYIDRTYAMGADSVCYHIGDLCSHGDQTTSPQRSKKRESELFAYASSVFPSGSILAHITIGPIGDRSNDLSKSEIQSLTKQRVLPVITLGDPEFCLQHQLNAKQIADVYSYSYQIAKQEKLRTPGLDDLPPFFTPWEGRVFSDEKLTVGARLKEFYERHVMRGGLTVGLSDLRRKLRVSEIADEDHQ